jgi:hypothetical protein
MRWAVPLNRLSAEATLRSHPHANPNRGSRILVSLIDQLQADALNPSVSIADLLRKTKAAAVKLRRPDLAAWVDQELFGYRNDIVVPEYRNLHTELKFFNPVRGWCPIVDGGHEVACKQPISELLSLLESKSSSFMISVPPEVVQHFSKRIGTFVDVKQEVQRSSVAGIADAVRSTVLDWALKLEEAGVHGEGLSFSASEAQRAQSVVINIGSIANATGLGAFGDNAVITATHKFTNVDELATAVQKLVDEINRLLPISGLPEQTIENVGPAITELRNAAHSTEPDMGRLRRGLEALREVMIHAGGHVVGAGILSLIDRVHSAL